MRLITMLPIAVLLVGCASSPYRIAMQSPEQLKSANARDLCIAYNFNRDAEAKAELERREALSDHEWDLAQNNNVQRGMSELALVCSWGYGKVNQSVGSWGTHKQWVYRPCQSCTAAYVYTENGTVTSWQN